MNELTNLLPEDRQRELRSEYFMRLAETASFMVAILIGAAALLMVPTYVYLSIEAGAKAAHLATIKASLASSDDASLSVRLTDLSSSAATLAALARAPSVSGLMRSILAISRPGVSITGFTYAEKSSKQPASIGVSGIAQTRDTLRAFQLALQDAPFSAGAALPVSVYAQDANIPFTITVTLAATRP